MALEIKELTIKVNVNERSTLSKDKERKIASFSHAKIVRECVELVMEKLESRFDR